jgi:hypothetical protein
MAVLPPYNLLDAQCGWHLLHSAESTLSLWNGDILGLVTKLFMDRKFRPHPRMCLCPLSRKWVQTGDCSLNCFVSKNPLWLLSMFWRIFMFVIFFFTFHLFLLSAWSKENGLWP